MPSWLSKSVSESVDGASMSLQTALVPELAASSDGAAVGTAEQIRPPVRLLTSVAMLLALSVAGGVGAVGRSMSLACTTPCMKALGYQGCLGWVPTLGCVHVVFAVPLAAIATSQLTVELGRLRSRGGLLATGAAATLAAVLAMVLLMKPWAAFDMADYKDANGNGVLVNDVLQVFIGGGVFMTALPLAFAAFAANASQDPAAGAAVALKGPSSSIDSVTDSTRRPFRAVLMLLLLWAACVLACSGLSPVWNYSFHSYSPAKSEYSILPETEYGEHKFVFKLYTDTVLYYLVMAAFTVLGAFGNAKVLRRRLRVLGAERFPSYHPYPEGATVGEVIVVLSVVVLYAWWLWYWRWGYPRIETEGSEPHHLDNKWDNHTNLGGKCCIEFDIPPPKNGSSWEKGDAGSCNTRADTPGVGGTASLHTWARVLGHMTSLSCSLLLLPATKNSAWFAILGVPFERALKYHRGLGMLTYIFVTLHMLLWWIKWAIEGTWWHNMTRPDDLKISPDWHHSDNFTIIVSEAAWLALTFMIGLALFARRSSYELFYYVHVPVGISFLVAALMHAWTFWYYAVGGLFLWTVDASLRTIRLARAGRGIPTDASFDRRTGVTTLTFEPQAFDHLAPAQYIFLCVPSLGLAERHPFTISSAPSASQRTLHIKALNGGVANASTFTDKLAQLVQAGGVSQLGDVRVDGPYGSAGDLTASKELVLVAGGIGVTPIISVFSELLALAKQPASSGLLVGTQLQRVRLVWVSRTMAELAIFAPVLHDAAVREEQQQQGGDTGVSFVSHLYSTGKDSTEVVADPAGLSEDAAGWLRTNVTAGRPDLTELCSDLSVDQSSTIFVCGPAPLTKAASEVAYSCGSDFHSEVFHF